MATELQAALYVFLCVCLYLWAHISELSVHFCTLAWVHVCVKHITAKKMGATTVRLGATSFSSTNSLGPLFQLAGSSLYGLAGTLSILSHLSMCWALFSGLACHPMNTKQACTHIHSYIHTQNTSLVSFCIAVLGQSLSLATSTLLSVHACAYKVDVYRFECVCIWVVPTDIDSFRLCDLPTQP